MEAAKQCHRGSSGDRAGNRGHARGRGYGVAQTLDITMSKDDVVDVSTAAAGPSRLMKSIAMEKKRRALDKKNMARLAVDERKRLEKQRESMEVGRFLMPDAPPSRRRRNVSPDRIPCPLIPGTPEVPPPRILQPWELEKLALDSSGPSSVELLEEGAVSPPSPKDSQLVITPSTRVIILDQGKELGDNLMVDASGKLLGSKDDVVDVSTAAAGPSRLMKSIAMEKKRRALDKKNMARLPVDQRQLLQKQRDKIEVGHFLMPDAPPSRRRRNVSPDRIPCPLIPGTPEVPPPRILQPWELKKLALDTSGPSSVELLEEGAASPPSPKDSQLVITPSTRVIILDQGKELGDNRIASVKLLGSKDDVVDVSTAAAGPSRLMKSITNEKNRRAQDKKNMARLTVDQRQRDRIEVGHFLMPDAPPSRNQRNVSPDRIPCPLIPGTPEVPPPRILKPWELEKLVLDTSGPSSVELLEEGAASPPSHKDSQLLITPSTEVIILDEGKGLGDSLMVDASVKLLGIVFSESPSMYNVLPDPST